MPEPVRVQFALNQPDSLDSTPPKDPKGFMLSTFPAEDALKKENPSVLGSPSLTRTQSTSTSRKGIWRLYITLNKPILDVVYGEGV